MITFIEWLGRFDEESREERLAREREAAERQKRVEDYIDKSREVQGRMPQAKPGSPDWEAFAREMPESPRDDFMYDVEEEIRRITGKSWSHGEIIDAVNGGPKQEADDERVTELMYDSYEDGSSPQETARMAVELIKSMGYL